MTIYLIRHTETNVSKSTIYGWSDVPLKDSFTDEWQRLKGKIEEVGAAEIAIFSSPLSRCTQLAEALSTHFSTNFETDNRLKELNFGDWEGKKWADIDAETLNNWMTNYVTIAPENGENYQQLANRATDFLTETMEKMPPSVSLFIVAHGGTIRALLHATIGVPLEKTFNFAVDYGSISTLNFKYGRFSLQNWNV